MEIQSFSLILNFSSIDLLQDYITDFREFQKWKLKKMIKKETDLRGAHIKDAHKKANEIKQNFPDLPYRDCLKMSYNNNNNIISNNC